MGRLVAAGLLALSVGGCTTGPEGGEGGAPYDGPPIPWAYAPFPEPSVPADNPQTKEKAALGLALFYDPILSRDEKTACVPVSVGVDGEGPVGPGRDGPNKTTRNSLTLWNVAFRPALFHDGRTPSLEEQALLPIENEREMDLPVAQAVAKLRAVPAYRALFEAAFPGEAEPINEQNLARALSAFQRTLVSKRATYDRYVAGDVGALADETVAGMFLFAEAGCASCHEPPLFEASRYARRLESSDRGRALVTGLPEDEGAFRIATLRNIRDSGPYFHDGRAVSLLDAVRTEVGVAVARGESRPMSDLEIQRIETFLDKALIDRSGEPARPRSVPRGLKVPADGNRIPR